MGQTDKGSGGALPTFIQGLNKKLERPCYKYLGIQQQGHQERANPGAILPFIHCSFPSLAVTLGRCPGYSIKADLQSLID